MARVLTWEDVINFGKAFLVTRPAHDLGGRPTIPRRCRRHHECRGWRNGSQLETSGGKVRASGTFTFVSGIVFYYCFTVSYIIYGFLIKGTFPKWMLYLVRVLPCLPW